MRRAILTFAIAAGSTACLGSGGGSSGPVPRGEARSLGMHATTRPADDLEWARQVLAQDAWRREHRFLDAVDPGWRWRASRPTQAQIDAGHFGNEELYGIGAQLFEIAADPSVGAGAADRPGVTLVHAGRRGGPDARACMDCHHVAGLAGAGTAADNAMLRGDGVHVSSAAIRNPPALFGAGLVELLAAQLGRELQRRRDEAIDFSADKGYPVEIPLTVQGLSFGTITVHPDGRVDTDAVRGVDRDLVIRPFGRKGRWANVREAIEDELLVHLGLQSRYLVENASAERIGPFGGDDPDGDGVVEEITEGQISALTLFVAMQDVPQEQPPIASDLLEQWAKGRSDFDSLGCATCHVPYLRLDTTEFRLPRRGSGPTRRVILAAEGMEPRIVADAEDDVVRLRLYSDLRRHDMGPELAELRSEGRVAAASWVTPPLWGIGSTGPYLHDGRAPTLDDAIVAHGGEATSARDAFVARTEAERAPLRVFLTSLVRAPKMVAH